MEKDKEYGLAYKKEIDTGLSCSWSNQKSTHFYRYFKPIIEELGHIYKRRDKKPAVTDEAA